MAEIRIEQRHAFAPWGTPYHTYLLYRPDGLEQNEGNNYTKWKIISAGAGETASTYNTYTINIDKFAWDKEEYKQSTDPVSDRGSRLLSSGAQADSLWNQLISHAKDIDAQGFDYDALALNCNSFTSTLLARIGMDFRTTPPGGSSDWTPAIDIFLGGDSADNQSFDYSYDWKFIGQDGNDHANGGSGDDKIYGDWSHSNDYEQANHNVNAGGDDVLSGGYGADELNGGAGNDRLSGDEFDDELYGGAGNDSLFGGDGNDELYGDETDGIGDEGSGNDVLIGGKGKDTLKGGGGDDIIDGSRKSASSNDLSQPGTESVGDDLYGGAGNDKFNVGIFDTIHDIDKGDSVYFGGSGWELLKGGKNDDLKQNGDTPPAGTYEGNHDEEYKYAGEGSTLRIQLPDYTGQEVEIKNFRNGDAGIEFEAEEDGDDHEEGGGGYGGGGGGYGMPGAAAGTEWGEAEENLDPLVLDLDGDGLELTALGDSSTYFDMDGDGFRENTAWVGADDGFLVLDRNGDGAITDINELFGNGVSDDLLSSNPADYAPGFAVLAALDANADGVIDAADGRYGELQVWRDLDGDGESGAGELISLADTGIASISLAAVQQQGLQINDQPVTATSTFTRADGTTGQIADVWLELDYKRTREASNAAEITEETQALIEALPWIKGFGEVSDLDVAMANDGKLLEMVQDLAALGVEDAHLVGVKVEAIMLRWFGVEDVGVESRGRFTDGQHLAAQDKWNGFEFNQGGQIGDPRPMAGALIAAGWQNLHAHISAQFLGQIALGETVVPGMQFKLGAFYHMEEGTTLETIVAAMVDNAPISEGGSQMTAEVIGYWHSMTQTLWALRTDFGIGGTAEVRAAIDSLLQEAGVPYSFNQLRNAFVAGDGNGDDGEVLVGKSSGMTVETSHIGGNDILMGGAGDDVMKGGDNFDIYIWGRGQGNDRIIDHVGGRWSDEFNGESGNHLHLLDGLSYADLRFEYDYNGLQIIILDTEERLRGVDDITKIIFADGTALATTDILADLFEANDQNNILYAKAGVNTTLEGLKGNDTLIGNTGNDTYVFNLGDGQDTIVEKYSLSNDTLAFGQEITMDMVAFSLSQNSIDLLVSIIGTEDRILIENQFVFNKYLQEGYTTIEAIRFADGTILNMDDIKSGLFQTSDADDTINGTHESDEFAGAGGDDILNGHNGHDTLWGDAGDDLVNGGAGSDTAYGGADNDTLKGVDGSDTLFGDSGEDILEGGAGDDTLDGGEDGDILDGGDGHDVLLGGSGVDILDGGMGDDTLNGGVGDDILMGGTGNDTFRFELGGGRDVITSSHGQNTLSFGNGIILSELTIEQSALGDLIVRLESTGDVLTIVGGLDAQGITTITFDYGLSITANEFAQLANPVEGGALVGTQGKDYLVIDYYDDDASDNRVDGGTGFDYLNGGLGNDTYVFGLGYGYDMISDRGGIADSIEFLPGITAADLSFEFVDALGRYDYKDMLIHIAGSDDAIRLRNVWDYSRDLFYIEEVRFADGSVIALSDLALGGLQGTDGDDYMGSDSSDDVLDGGAGNDLLEGRRGNDIYVFDRGYGVDTIIENSGSSDSRYDRLDMSGLSSEEVSFSFNRLDLVITVDDSDDQVILKDYFEYYATSSYYGVEYIGFSDKSYHTYNIKSMLAQPTAGDDILVGNSNGYEDTLDGLAGNDLLFGGGGNDTYIFGYGSGQDEVLEEGWTYEKSYLGGGDDRILLKSNITRDNMTFSLQEDGKSVLLTLNGTDDSILFTQHLEKVEFQATGEVMTYGEIYSQFLANTVTDGDDEIHYVYRDNRFDPVVIDAKGGNDTIYIPAQKSDGYDDAKDIVIFGKGSGQDWVVGTPVIRLKEGITQDDVSLVRSREFIDGGWRDIVKLNIYGSDDSLSVRLKAEDKYMSKYLIKSVEFHDGSVWSHKDIFERTIKTEGTEEDDYIFMPGAGDVIEGGAGNDTFDAGGYGDSQTKELIFSKGFGQDIFTLHHSSDVAKDHRYIVLTFSGITTSEVRLSLVGHKDRDLLIKVVDEDGLFTGDSLTIQDGLRAPVSYFLNFEDKPWADLHDILQDHFKPTEGDDVLLGNLGDGYGVPLDGGAGNDDLKGGMGSDKYVFGRGYNSDMIYEDHLDFDFIFSANLKAWEGNYSEAYKPAQATDIVTFGADIGLSDLVFLRGGDGLEDLIIRIAGTEDKLVIKGQLEEVTVPAGLPLSFSGNPFYKNPNGVEEFHFADGTVLTAGQVIDLISGEDWGGGNTLETGPDGGVLDGGGGHDVLKGGTGNDTYIFDRGYAEDRVEDAGGWDSVEFGAGMSLGDLNLVRTGETQENLLIEVGGEERLTMTIVGQFAADNSGRIEDFTFADGTTLDWVDVQAMMLQNAATQSADEIVGFASDDLIEGMGGNDTLSGAGGDDLLLGGTGWDTVVLNGAASDYDVVFKDDGTVQVTDLRAGSANTDGVDILESIEALSFNVSSESMLLVPANEMPLAGSDSASGLEDTVIQIPLETLLSNDTDPDSEAITLIDVKDGINGQVWVNLQGNIAFKPDANFVGLASFTYVIEDAYGATSEATVELMITNVNDIPEIAGMTFEGLEDETLTGTLEAFDVDGDPLHYAVISGPAHGDLTLDAQSGAFIVTPDAHYFGADSFTVSVDDGNGGISETVIDLNILGVNDAPLVEEDSFTVIRDQAFSGQIEASDVEDTDLRYYISAQAAHGSLTLDETSGSFTYEALQGYVGDDSFTIYVVDTEGNWSEGEVTLSVVESDLTLIEGTDGPDKIRLHKDPESYHIKGYGGNDDIRAGYGDDLIEGGMGDDKLEGARGDDSLFGNAGDDELEGERGNDILYGGGDHDDLEGGAGDDTLYGEDGRDELEGEKGDDTLYGGAGDDELEGNSGDDLLYGGAGDDELEGKKDNDTLYGEGGDDELEGNKGDDILHGGDERDELEGNKGDDTLYGDAGNDDLEGGRGDDVMIGGTGDDKMEGGKGDDLYVIGSAHGRDEIDNHDKSGFDTLLFGDGIAFDELWFEKSKKDGDLLISHLGSDTVVEIDDWFDGGNSGSYHVEAMRTDTHGLSHDDVSNLVDAMASLDKPENGPIDFTDPAYAFLSLVLQNAWSEIV